MATRKQSPKSARRGNRTAKHGSLSSRNSTSPQLSAMDGMDVVDILQESIDAERDNLSLAESLLGCLAISMEHGAAEHEDESTPPYYPDIARMARRLVRRSINALDPLAVQQFLRQRKIKEETQPWGGEQRTQVAPWWPLFALPQESSPHLAG